MSKTIRKGAYWMLQDPKLGLWECNACDEVIYETNPDMVEEELHEHIEAHLTQESEHGGISPLVEGSTIMHEVFLAYREAGFTEDQALKLVANMILANIKDEQDG